MRITINDKEVIIPSSLSEFTLGQRIAFHEQYGKQLEEMAKSILEIEDETARELELVEFRWRQMINTFAFFANVTPEAVEESEFLDQIASIYYASMAMLFEDQEELELQQEFIWKDETWELSPPVLNNGSKITFGEFIDSKSIVKDTIDLGGGRWDYMPKLCAIYLRKKGEPYTEELTYEDSERIQLMHELPMDIALQVGFFLTASLNLFNNTLRSSRPLESKELANSVRATMKNGVGSIS